MAESRWGELGLEEKNICDEFRPLTLFGRGTFGAVWAAALCRQQYPKVSGDSVAVKSINDTSFSRQVLAREGYLGRELAVIKLLAADPHAPYEAILRRILRWQLPRRIARCHRCWPKHIEDGQTEYLQKWSFGHTHGYG